jgi:hypothetical protein
MNSTQESTTSQTFSEQNVLLQLARDGFFNICQNPPNNMCFAQGNNLEVDVFSDGSLTYNNSENGTVVSRHKLVGFEKLPGDRFRFSRPPSTQATEILIKENIPYSVVGEKLHTTVTHHSGAVYYYDTETSYIIDVSYRRREFLTRMLTDSGHASGETAVKVEDNSGPGTAAVETKDNFATTVVKTEDDPESPRAKRPKN